MYFSKSRRGLKKSWPTCTSCRGCPRKRRARCTTGSNAPAAPGSSTRRSDSRGISRIPKLTRIDVRKSYVSGRRQISMCDSVKFWRGSRIKLPRTENFIVLTVSFIDVASTRVRRGQWPYEPAARKPYCCIPRTVGRHIHRISRY